MEFTEREAFDYEQYLKPNELFRDDYKELIIKTMEKMFEDHPKEINLIEVSATGGIWAKIAKKECFIQ